MTPLCQFLIDIDYRYRLKRALIGYAIKNIKKRWLTIILNLK